MSNVLVSSQRRNNIRLKRCHPWEVLKTTLIEMIGNVDMRKRKLIFICSSSPYFINTTGQSITQELRSKYKSSIILDFYYYYYYYNYSNIKDNQIKVCLTETFKKWTHFSKIKKRKCRYMVNVCFCTCFFGTDVMHSAPAKCALFIKHFKL